MISNRSIILNAIKATENYEKGLTWAQLEMLFLDETHTKDSENRIELKLLKLIDSGHIIEKNDLYFIVE